MYFITSHVRGKSKMQKNGKEEEGMKKKEENSSTHGT